MNLKSAWWRIGVIVALLIVTMAAALIAAPKLAPTYRCDYLIAEKVDRAAYRFTTAATAKNGVVITGYTYDFGDSQRERGGAIIDHVYAVQGTYEVTVTVHVKVAGHVKSVTHEKCRVTLKVQWPTQDSSIRSDATRTNRAPLQWAPV